MQRVNMGAIQTFARKEIKFLLTEQQYQDFLPLLNHYMNPDKFCVGGKEYGIYNIYYDTPDDFLIRESLEKPDYKEKIRLRSYLSPAQPEDTETQLRFSNFRSQVTFLRHSQRTPCSWKSKRKSAALSISGVLP